MFMGPFEATMIWDEKTLSGVKRFLERIEDLLSHFIDLNKQFVEHTDSIKFLEVLNKTILKITEDIDNFGFNTAIAKLMELGNYLQSERNNPKNALIESGEKEKRLWAISNESIRKIIKLIAPMAPYLAEELWKAAGESGSVHEADWPKADLKFLVQETITIPVAVNGKVRDQLTMVNDKRQMREEVIRQAKDLEKIKKWLEGKEVIRKIYIVGKMINLVVRD
jgi:leucyl-tRNA synthetase